MYSNFGERLSLLSMKVHVRSLQVYGKPFRHEYCISYCCCNATMTWIIVTTSSTWFSAVFDSLTPLKNYFPW